MAAHRDLGLGAEDGIFELQVDIFPKIGASLSAAAFASAASAKYLAQPEEVPENITQVVSVEALRSHAAQASVAVTVVGGALVAVCQHGVGFAAFFEFVFGVWIIGIAVGMELQRQFAIGALDLLIVGSAGYAQHLIVIAFSVAGQNGLSPKILSEVSEVQRLGLLATFTIEGRSRRFFNL